MQSIRDIVLDYPLSDGACTVGIATPETLEGGPPSVDLNFVLPGARSAIVFALPLDQSLINPFLAKQDRLSHERDNFQTNVMASGIAFGLSTFLTQKGYPSTPVASNNVYRQPEIKMGLMLPDISLRYLAVQAGLGHFGLSGNVLTPKEGAAVIFGAVVTEAELEPTGPLPEDENYCDDCRLCIASCASDFMDRNDKDRVMLGGTEYTYSKRRSQLRCQFVCGGFSGLHKSGKWSTWSPGRVNIPDADDELLPVMIPGFKAYLKWPDIEGGQYHVMMRKKLLLTCGHCQLMCHPDKEVRKQRHKTLIKSGVVIQSDDGTLEAVSPAHGEEWAQSLSDEQKALYGVEC